MMNDFLDFAYATAIVGYFALAVYFGFQAVRGDSRAFSRAIQREIAKQERAFAKSNASERPVFKSIRKTDGANEGFGA